MSAPSPTARVCTWTQDAYQNLKTGLHCHVSRGPLLGTDLPPVQQFGPYLVP